MNPGQHPGVYGRNLRYDGHFQNPRHGQYLYDRGVMLSDLPTRMPSAFELDYMPRTEDGLPLPTRLRKEHENAAFRQDLAFRKAPPAESFAPRMLVRHSP